MIIHAVATVITVLYAIRCQSWLLYTEGSKVYNNILYLYCTTKIARHTIGGDGD